MKINLEKRIAVLSGSGISAESGISTFRDSGGLWEQYDITEVATPEAFEANPELVQSFYNARRKELLSCEPNEGHKALVRLEEYFDVDIVTQNVDDLHERAGSSKVLHLHGELRKVRSTGDESLVYNWDKDLKQGDLCEKGYQLRPHIVWFGEMVPMIEVAAEIIRRADILIIVGTSLVVYPAAGLVQYTDFDVPKYVVDPARPDIVTFANVEFIEKTAAKGLPELVERLINAS